MALSGCRKRRTRDQVYVAPAVLITQGIPKSSGTVSRQPRRKTKYHERRVDASDAELRTPRWARPTGERTAGLSICRPDAQAAGAGSPSCSGARRCFHAAHAGLGLGRSSRLVARGSSRLDQRLCVRGTGTSGRGVHRAGVGTASPAGFREGLSLPAPHAR